MCANTLNTAPHTQTNTITIRHTYNVKARLGQAHKVIGITDPLSTQVEDIFNHWSKVHISNNEVKNLSSLP